MFSGLRRGFSGFHPQNLLLSSFLLSKAQKSNKYRVAHISIASYSIFQSCNTTSFQTPINQAFNNKVQAFSTSSAQRSLKNSSYVSRKVKSNKYYGGALFRVGAGLLASFGVFYGISSTDRLTPRVLARSLDSEAFQSEIKSQSNKSAPGTDEDVIPSSDKPEVIQPPFVEKDDPNQPFFTEAELASHRTPETGIWVTFKGGVYNITDFVEMHPGGRPKIMMAAGASIEPFWAMYQQHQKIPEIVEILEGYRIGKLEGYDPSKAPVYDPYQGDPSRHPSLLIRSQKPFNAETPAAILDQELITPTDVFYVRNHLPVPHIDMKTFKLEVIGEGLTSPLVLDVDELRERFAEHKVTVTLMCSGNRRNEMKAIRPVKGLEWDTGAIGTCTFTGVKLRDILAAAGLDVNADPEPWHVIFVGSDTDPLTGDRYAASIPIQKAINPMGDCLIAYEMNGEPLTTDHGFPLRAVVPGVTGARNVKWLAKVIVSKEESGSHWQQKDYKSFNPQVDWDTVNWCSAPAIQDTPITSAICSPEQGENVKIVDGKIRVHGYAWSGGGRGVVRVDVTLDEGATWTTAYLKTIPEQEAPRAKFGKAWAWSFWEVDIPVPAGFTSGKLKIASRAVDDSYNNQPDTVSAIWNLRGVVNNAWHRISVNVEQ